MGGTARVITSLYSIQCVSLSILQIFKIRYHHVIGNSDNKECTIATDYKSLWITYMLPSQRFATVP